MRYLIKGYYKVLLTALVVILVGTLYQAYRTYYEVGNYLKGLGTGGLGSTEQKGISVDEESGVLTFIEEHKIGSRVTELKVGGSRTGVELWEMMSENKIRSVLEIWVESGYLWVFLEKYIILTVVMFVLLWVLNSVIPIRLMRHIHGKENVTLMMRGACEIALRTRTQYKVFIVVLLVIGVVTLFGGLGSVLNLEYNLIVIGIVVVSILMIYTFVVYSMRREVLKVLNK